MNLPDPSQMSDQPLREEANWVVPGSWTSPSSCAFSKILGNGQVDAVLSLCVSERFVTQQ